MSHRPSAYQNGLFFRDFRRALPKGGIATLFAKANDALIDEEDVGFHVALLHRLAFFAAAAFQWHATSLLFSFGNWGKVDAPKVYVGVVRKRHAVGVDLAFGANPAYNAYQSFPVGIQIANDDLLLGGEFIRGNDAGAVAAEQDSLRHFREAFAIQIASGQKDSDLFWNATAAAEVFVGHDVRSSRKSVLKPKVNRKCAKEAQKLGSWFHWRNGKGGVLRRARGDARNVARKERPTV